MVFIKKIEARGFKSYGNNVFSIKFDQSFTAITGPNGSGKSNIIDSIVFCIGQNSPKKLRVDRLTSLIYDGGSSAKRPQSVRVSVSFDNTARRIPVDADTVTVTRELTQNSENYYLLNGKQVNRTSIMEMLELALITPEGLNIVPQGLITRLSELVPDEKRDLIEEVIGVAQFDEKKIRAIEQLRDADTRLQVALARIEEMKNRVDELECERNDHLRLKMLEDEIRWLKAVLTSRNIFNTKRRIIDENRFLDSYKESYDKLTKDMDEIDKLLSKSEIERKEFVSNFVDDAGGQRVELELAIGRIESEISILKEEISASQTLIQKIEKSLPYLTNMREQNEKEVSNLDQIIQDNEKQVIDLETNKKELDKNVIRIDSKQTHLRTVLENKKLQSKKLQQRIEDYEKKKLELVRFIENNENKRTLINDKLSLLNEKSQTFLETLSYQEEQLKKLDELAQTESESIINANSSLKDLAERENKLQEEIANAVFTLNKANEVINRYETEISVSEKIVGEELASRRLEELAKTGAVEGYIGTLENLISFSSEYETPILAACRRWMKTAIVKDVKTMIRTVGVAKRLKIGRLLIIPLSELEDSKKVTLPKEEGVIGTLADVINHDDKMKSLVDFIFGDIILTKNIKTAYISSTKGFRSVTMSGDLFEPKHFAFETGYIAKINEITDIMKDETSLGIIREALLSLRNTISKRKTDMNRLQVEVKKVLDEKSTRELMLERIRTERNTIAILLHKYTKLKKKIELNVETQKKDIERLTRRIIKLGNIQTIVTTKTEKIKNKIIEIGTETTVNEIEILEKEKIDEKRVIEELTIKTRDLVTQLSKNKGNLEHNLKPSLLRQVEQLEKSSETLKEKKTFIEEGIIKLNDLLEKHKLLKLKEKETLEKTRMSRPTLERYEMRIERIRKNREDLKKSIGNIDKEIISTVKNLERLDESEKRLLGEITLYGYSEPIEVFDMADLLLEQLSLEYESLKNNVNLLASSSYKEVFMNYKNLSVRRNQLESERNAVVKFIENVESEKKKVFMTGFEKIDKELRAIFSRITNGSAWLELEDSEDVFSKGVFLMAQFPNKLPRDSSAVSGGEKTVSALALILAIQSVYPSPFYLFDEIDANLDAVNSEKLGELLRERAERSQIITVTLKDTVLARAHTIFGAYTESGTSKIVKYKPNIDVVTRSG